MPKLSRVRKTSPMPFTTSIEQASRPLMKEFARSVQASLQFVVNQAVSQFFHPHQPNSQTQPTQPEGFRRVGPYQNAGWFNMKKTGNTLQGRLLGMFDRPDPLSPIGSRHFFQVQISTPCEVRAGRGEDAVLRTENPGAVVNLNYGPATKDLEFYIPKMARGAEIDVFATVAGPKIKLSGGRSMSHIELYTKMVSAPRTEDDLETETSDPPSGIRRC